MIFSRRIIQKILDENSKFLSHKHMSKHVNLLNRADEDSINFVWEVVLLNALSKLGNVVHEPDLGGTSHIDILFSLYSNPDISFIADIATVSDKGLEQENPVGDFVKELNKQIKKFDLSPHRFFWILNGEPEGQYGDRKMKLKIPKRSDFKSFFDGDFKAFLIKVRRNPDYKERYIKKTDLLDIVISYDPSLKGQWGNYPCYQKAHSLTKNPIYNNLKRKTVQLKKTEFEGPKIIILCDGDCEGLRSISNSNFNFGTLEIINNFLKENSSISAVITIHIERSLIPFYGIGSPLIRTNFIENLDSTNPLNIKLLSRLHYLPQFLPKPVDDVRNAINRLKDKEYRKEGVSFYGGFSVTHKSIRISSRALLELLSGRKDFEEFQKDHSWFGASGKEQKTPNYFERKLREGRLFSNIYLEKSNEEDDDWITFEFGDPDPAIFNFIVSQKEK